MNPDHAAADSPPEQPRRRFRPRFSLRALLVAMAVFAVLSAWHYRARRQTDSISHLLSSNPSTGVYYAHQFDRQGALDRDASAPGPEWLERFTGTDYLSSVTVVEMLYATDADLTYVAQLPGLERLVLVRAVDVTDKGLAQLSGLKQLRTLKLFDADMLTDAGIAYLARMRNLERLTLGPRPRLVTAEAIERLRRALPNCRIEITDEEGDERQLLTNSEVG